MNKPRIIIADTDINYITPLQLQLVHMFFDKIELEIITDREYLTQLFSVPQSIDILIIDEQLYQESLQMHNIANVFVMTDSRRVGETQSLNIAYLYKYTSIREIMKEIVGKSTRELEVVKEEKEDTKVILVTSASGGAGKTTLAMGISAALIKNYKSVLYINVSRLQSFHHMLENKVPIESQEVYSKLFLSNEDAYLMIKHLIRNESFHYLPAFKAALPALNISKNIYERIVRYAKRSQDYDYIVLDVESTYDEEMIRLLSMADRVVIATTQNKGAVEATNDLVNNISGMNTGKYIFLCNKFEKNKSNALVDNGSNLKFSVHEYIERIAGIEKLKNEELVQDAGIQKLTYLVL